MDEEQVSDSEELQRLIVRTVAVGPAGRNLILIGGFRYRFLDNSVRASRDVDYHWDGDLAEKQNELVALFQRTLLPEVRRALQYDGSATPALGPDADSPVVRVVDLAFWKSGVPGSRIEIPVEITRIARMDPTVPVVKQGTVYPTASEKDMVESKVIALLNRTFVEHRDLVDVYLFQNQLSDDCRERLRIKFDDLGIGEAAIRKRIADFVAHPNYHAQAIQTVVDEQLAPGSAAAITDAGGGRLILETVLRLLERYVLGQGEGGK